VRTICALVPSGRFMGTAKTVVRSERMVSVGRVIDLSAQG